MKKEERTDSKVKSLLKICNERTKGYLQAAQKVNDKGLTLLFEKYAQQSKMFADELTAYRNPIEAGEGIVKDDMIDPELSKSAKNPKLMLSVCATRERQALELYEKSLSDEMPEELKRKIEQQLSEIRIVYQSLKHLGL